VGTFFRLFRKFFPKQSFSSPKPTSNMIGLIHYTADNYASSCPLSKTLAQSLQKFSKLYEEGGTEN